ncbi:MAG: bifunctional 5,10-methylenetetrahydrofolate dehydrogenase/5,10-methenyltetrahydrofolate cyclohydrolase [Bacilli bacterium]|jgi:methylenetetrahydrofolate dehydrogenase (NADP+)/methenyltetrahydrofolate cyclohydrolase|nr:bifunctional 5,10-methylenetetrahydrofolate dehydrogenase/5,10-methenyltetrahydrofolate cyclohydrolase [Bacilli bacterium]MDD3120805.1 bifunctional 5,10-methylenetetrahydrofolate dehydrogenase/5,10-methenyltetrahydrofolate cyclohydrolase [Bacilli bacterium]MDD4063000.1 bifunctional 5,10-methylenetetrahydrofolate dehydrogenase/5,10-methenyltetrahydrofolate cyclohydrolase [Bacilli bacterium]MDD4481720.1 bifunctional 5,10-methylenetetrahydrofolate dehydrogenase/5,10-methenyltetrahydrofolate cycl
MLLDGKLISEEIKKRVAEEVYSLNDTLTLAIILVGKDPASEIYVNSKTKACEKAGIKTKDYFLDNKIPEKELIDLIRTLNEDPLITGILVQMPLPSHISEDNVVNSIDPAKDVDGLNIINQGKLLNNANCIVPATPKGILSLLKRYFVEISGKHAVIIGRSKLVGKPMALLLLNNNATITVCHSRTENLKEIVKRADIVIVAIGKPKFLTADMVKKDAAVIDVGINRVQGKIVGDVDFEEVSEVASYITPVPRGVGPMTIASLLENVVKCYHMQNK